MIQQQQKRVSKEGKLLKIGKWKQSGKHHFMLWVELCPLTKTY